MQSQFRHFASLLLMLVSGVSCLTTPSLPAGEPQWGAPEESLAPADDPNPHMMASEPHLEGAVTAPTAAFSCGDIPEKVDLSQHDTRPKVQYGGRCSSYGLIAAMENRAKQMKLRLNEKDTLDLSETHLFWAQRFKYSSPVALATASKIAIMDEEFWREDNYAGIRRKILHRLWGHPDARAVNTEGLQLERFTQIHQETQGGIAPLTQQQFCTALRALADGKPLYMALSVNGSLYQLDSPVQANGPETGGHAVAVVGYELKREGASSPLNGTFLIKNSWGALKPESKRVDGVRAGYQNLPFSYCWTDDKYCGLWAIDSVKVQKVTRVFRP